MKFDVALSSGASVKTETLGEMWTPAKFKNHETASIDQMPYGLGWFVWNAGGHSVVDHPGWTGTLYLKYPNDRLSIIVLTNLDSGSGSAQVTIAQGILELLRPELPRFLPEHK